MLPEQLPCSCCFISLLCFSKSGTNPGWRGPWYSVAFLRALRSVNIVWWMPPCVCLWKLIHLMVHVIFCCACSYSKTTAESLGWSVDSQACSVCAWVSCQRLFLMPRWLNSVRNAPFQIVLGTNWHSAFSTCPQGLYRAGFSSGQLLPCSDSARWPRAFRGGKALLAFQLAGGKSILL